MNADEVLAEVGGRKVVRVGQHFVVKYGEAAEEVEAATMLFLNQTTSINLPNVYAVYRTGAESTLVIVMEYIPGTSLDKMWPTLSATHKAQICYEIKRQIDQMRNLHSPGYYGGVGRQPMPDGIFWTGDEERNRQGLSGPFQSENELNDALVSKTLFVDQTWNGRGPHRAQFYQRMLPNVLRDHEPVFTHADLQRKNIMISPRPANEDSLSTTESTQHAHYHVTLVDWEKAGWYPSYWEYCAASWAFRFDDDWPAYLERILKPWPVEYAWLRILRDELWS